MTRKVAAVVRSGQQNGLTGGRCSGAGAAAWSRSVAGRELVTMVVVRWPESHQRRPEVAAALGVKLSKMENDTPMSWEKARV